MPDAVMETRGLVKQFPVEGSRDVVHAVSGVDLQARGGETLGLVGESGCGKTTIGRLVLRLIEPTSGQVFIDGRDLGTLRPRELRRVRSQMQIVFQNPFASLNPRMSVEQIVSRPMLIHLRLTARERSRRVGALLEQVGLREEHRPRHPHEFSGGQRQRIAIARALAVEPKFLVLDEPTSALDVSVQAQILNLLRRLQQELGLTYLFISHDLSAVRHMSDRIAVMYLGKVVEASAAEDLFAAPLHPYTRALMSAIPVTNPRLRRERLRLAGDIPSPIRLPTGCAFHTRCPVAVDRCRHETPSLRQVGPRGDHQVACHLVEDDGRVAAASVPGSAPTDRAAGERA
jgi:oligopeptide transport system ATP-binding protein